MNTAKDEMDIRRSQEKAVEVSVRTPAGHSHQFTFKDRERVSKVTREAVEHFVSTGELADGDYGLALLRDGRAIELNDAEVASVRVEAGVTSLIPGVDLTVRGSASGPVEVFRRPS